MQLNKKQRITGIIFAIIILITSFIILEKSALAGIIGLCASAGLLIYCFSGSSGESIKKYSFKGILKSKVFKRILIGVIIGIIIIIGIASYIQYVQGRKAEESKKIQKDSEAFKKEERRNNYKYLQDNIEIMSSRIDSEELRDFMNALYLFIQIKNKGDWSAGNFSVRLTYYDENKYLINKQTVNIPEWISPGEEKKFKILLFTEIYPYSEINQIKSFEISLLSCKTIRFIRGGLKPTGRFTDLFE